MALVDPSTRCAPPMRWLLWLQAAAAAATGVTLIAAPKLIPSSAGLHINADSYSLCYLIAASELSLAMLSWRALSAPDARTLHLIGRYFVVFHSLSALAGAFAIATGASDHLLGTIGMHVLIAVLFIVFLKRVRGA